MPRMWVHSMTKKLKEIWRLMMVALDGLNGY
jgi:hypothetical protein